MSSSELLQIDPHELQFTFELKKQISCTIKLTNKSNDYVAFKVKTTNPKKYCVKPNTGVVSPRSTYDVIVTMQAQTEAPLDLQCRDKFLLQSVVVTPGLDANDVTAQMFNKESGNRVDECKLRVVYVPSPQPPSSVREGLTEGSLPRSSLLDNGTASQTSEFNSASEAFAKPRESTSEKALISKLTEEKLSAIQQTIKLQQELKLIEAALRQQKNLESISSHVPMSFPERRTNENRDNDKCVQAEVYKQERVFDSLKLEEPAPKEKKGRASPPMWYVTEEELNSVPAYMKQRLTLDKVNAAIGDMATYAETNTHLITAPRKKLTEKNMDRALELRDIAAADLVKGRHFFLESDIKGPALKLDNTGRAILTVLRHMGRITETRIGHHRVMILLRP